MINTSKQIAGTSPITRTYKLSSKQIAAISLALISLFFMYLIAKNVAIKNNAAHIQFEMIRSGMTFSKVHKKILTGRCSFPYQIGTNERRMPEDDYFIWNFGEESAIWLRTADGKPDSNVVEKRFFHRDSLLGETREITQL